MNLKTAVLALTALAASGLLIAFVVLQNFLDSPANVPEGGAEFEIAAGSSFSRVSNDLAAVGIIDKPEWLRWYARITGDAADIHAGHFQLVAGETPREILQKFVSGDVESAAFTIVEGWNFRELLAAMAAADDIRSSIVYEDWPAVLESFGAEQQHPEGLFLPETYHFPKHSRDVDVLRQAYTLMQQALADEWKQRSENLPLQSPYEALTLASIIEKETARADERQKISGVFVRRLEIGMRLQTDPTVIYGIGPEFNGNITRRDLRTDTPYNTYTRHGLPPTPIAMPGRAAIHAALNPASGTELFFVATGLGDGSHKFSATKEEHDAAVQEYLARRRANRQSSQKN